MENLLKKFKLDLKPSKKKAIINPQKHWIMILKIFFTAIILLVIFSLYLLYEIKNEKVFNINNVVKQPPALLKDKLLEDVTNSFDLKYKKSLELNSNSIIFKDPSL